MTEYIERIKLVEKIVNTPFGLNCTGESDDYKEGVLRGLIAKQNNVIDMIKDQPPADVAPVVHGAWEDIYKNYETAECSQCKSQFEVTFDNEANRILWKGFKSFYKYCPNCGAKMDLEDENEST